MHRILLAASLTALLAATPPTAGAGGLVNGSFEPACPLPAGERGPIPGWQASGSVDWRQAGDDGFAAPNGDRVACFPVGADRGTCLRQSFATVPGQAYDVLFWLGSQANERGRGRAALRVAVTGSVCTVAIDNCWPETLWQAHDVRFVAVDTLTTLAFSALPRRGNVAAYLDGVAVRPAAPPPPLAAAR